MKRQESMPAVPVEIANNSFGDSRDQTEDITVNVIDAAGV